MRTHSQTRQVLSTTSHQEPSLVVWLLLQCWGSQNTRASPLPPTGSMPSTWPPLNLSFLKLWAEWKSRRNIFAGCHPPLSGQESPTSTMG